MVSMSQLRQNTKIKAIQLLKQKAHRKKELAVILSNFNNWKLKTNMEILEELEDLGYCSIVEGMIKVFEK